MWAKRGFAWFVFSGMGCFYYPVKNGDLFINHQDSYYPPGNQHIPWKVHFEDDFPFPQVGYVNFLEGIHPKFNANVSGRAVWVAHACLIQFFGGQTTRGISSIWPFEGWEKSGDTKRGMFWGLGISWGGQPGVGLNITLTFEPKIGSIPPSWQVFATFLGRLSDPTRGQGVMFCDGNPVFLSKSHFFLAFRWLFGNPWNYFPQNTNKTDQTLGTCKQSLA